MIDVNVLAGADIRRLDGKLGKIKKVSMPWVTLEWSDGTHESFLRSDQQLTDDCEIQTLNKGWVPLGTVVGINEKVAKASTDDQGQEETDDDEDEEKDGENDGEDTDDDEDDDDEVDESKTFGALANELREMLAPAPIYEATEKAKSRAKAALGKSKKDSGKKPASGGAGPGDSPQSPFYNYAKIGQNSPSKKTRSYKGIWSCSGTEAEQTCVALKDVPEQGIKKGSTKVVKMWKGKAAYTKKYEKGRKKGTYRLPNGAKAPVKHPHYIPTGADVSGG